mgnify:CR=1 FL=1
MQVKFALRCTNENMNAAPAARSQSTATHAMSAPHALGAAVALLCAALASSPLPAADLDRGRELNEVCAACHGEFGQGGKRGEYPRIAGQSAEFLKDALKAFRARQRINIPMFPYTQDRELPDADIEDVAAYLASVRLPTRPPEFKDTDDALTRLRAMERVMIVPRIDGDAEAGERVYQKECAVCHGRTGLGRRKFPRLVGQYTDYLARQVGLFVKGERPHDEVDTGGVLNRLDAKTITDILAWLTTIQGREEPAAP